MILDEILRTTEAQTAARRRRISFEQLEKSLAQAPVPRGFVASLLAAQEIGLIAELKRASPSAGRLRQDFPVTQLARQLAAGGADCLSVLTETPHFEGSLDNLTRAAPAARPLLQKDFVLDAYQVVEGRVAGADAVLLIAEALAESRARELCDLALDLGMDVLYEAHDPASVARVVRLARRRPERILVGVNNRNLKSFRVDPHTALEVAAAVGRELHVVGESGIRTAEDVLRLRDAGARGVLVGESLMRQADVEQAVRTLLVAVRRH